MSLNITQPILSTILNGRSFIRTRYANKHTGTLVNQIRQRTSLIRTRLQTLLEMIRSDISSKVAMSTMQTCNLFKHQEKTFRWYAILEMDSSGTTVSGLYWYCEERALRCWPHSHIIVLKLWFMLQWKFMSMKCAFLTLSRLEQRYNDCYVKLHFAIFSPC
jgi:hypothetical protein